MQKLTFPFLNTKSPIPIVCFPLNNGKSIYAIIDTGSDSTVYDAAVKDAYPELFIKTKHFGKQTIFGVHEKREEDVYISGLRLDLKLKEQENLAVKLVAYEHSVFCKSIKPLVDIEGISEGIPLLIGSDTLNRFDAKIDMKKKAITFTIRKKKTE